MVNQIDNPLFYLQGGACRTFFRNLPFLLKVLLTGILSMLFISSVLFILYVTNQVQAYVDKARAICLTAEATIHALTRKVVKLNHDGQTDPALKEMSGVDKIRENLFQALNQYYRS